ncbi:hypothetical protein A4D02_32240 [Niastella koreensis]|uniref:Uncharacterized protein n=2 Tax=Niastella koreensis TaxID=354356 RepID=G8TBX9_NIAKG|nr:hypothetical protein [Niastella koreensis]AEV99272.1 hypothetical protein Niako_2941 [Niastella koreensis GR20-10]OQP46061.1 hypothetical protein A4D02_32240 [Niastella koreensis]
MQKRLCCILICLFTKNVLLCQSIEASIDSQFDEIALSKKGNTELIIGAFKGNEVFVVKRTNDSLFATTYLTSVSNEVGGVFSILINEDTLFSKKVDSLYRDIRQNHSYEPYSKGALTGGNFFLTFCVNDKLQIFDRKSASQNQLTKIDFITRRLSIYAIIPVNGYGKHLKPINVKDWNELLKYLKNGTIDSIPN